MITPIALLVALNDPSAWTRWSPREEIAPRMFVDPVVHRLAINGNSNAAAFGGWERRVDPVEPGKWYRLIAHYRAEAVPHENLQVLARLDWVSANGKRAGQPDYAFRTAPAGLSGW